MRRYVSLSTRLLQPGDQGPEVERLYRFLSRFGYIARHHSSEVATGAGERRFDEPLERAIRHYQRNFRLRETGTLDAPTLAHMEQPRCGLPDTPFIAPWAPLGSIWRKTDITYGFDNFTNDLEQHIVRNAIGWALQKWSNVAPLRFSESSNPDIKLHWQSIDGAFQILARATSPGTGAHVTFDEDERWSRDLPPLDVDLESVAIHEIGHTLGLGHSNDPNAIMYPSLPFQAVKRDLTPDDILGIRSRYAVALHRRFRPDNGNHFWTTDPNEALEPPWQAEQVACRAFALQVHETIPLHRRLNVKNGDHFWTTNPDEAISFPWEDEQIACYVFAGPVPGSVPLYRRFNTSNGQHFYTIDPNEAAEPPWESEGIACFVFPP